MLLLLALFLTISEMFCCLRGKGLRVWVQQALGVTCEQILDAGMLTALLFLFFLAAVT